MRSWPAIADSCYSKAFSKSVWYVCSPPCGYQMMWSEFVSTIQIGAHVPVFAKFLNSCEDSPWSSVLISGVLISVMLSKPGRGANLAAVRSRGSPAATTPQNGPCWPFSPTLPPRETENSLLVAKDAEIEKLKKVASNLSLELQAAENKRTLRERKVQEKVELPHRVPWKPMGRPLNLKTLRYCTSICATGSQFSKVRIMLLYWSYSVGWPAAKTEWWRSGPENHLLSQLEICVESRQDCFWGHSIVACWPVQEILWSFDHLFWWWLAKTVRFLLCSRYAQRYFPYSLTLIIRPFCCVHF